MLSAKCRSKREKIPYMCQCIDLHRRFNWCCIFFIWRFTGQAQVLKFLHNDLGGTICNVWSALCLFDGDSQRAQFPPFILSIPYTLLKYNKTTKVKIFFLKYLSSIFSLSWLFFLFSSPFF